MAENSIIELEQNLEDFEDFEPLPAGTYEGVVTSAEMKISDKGNEYYYVVWNIHPDAFPADYAVDNAPDGLSLLYARLQKPDVNNRRSITSVKNFYRSLGMKLKTSVINPGEWEGKKAALVVGIEPFNGEPRNVIKSIEALV